MLLEEEAQYPIIVGNINCVQCFIDHHDYIFSDVIITDSVENFVYALPMLSFGSFEDFRRLELFWLHFSLI